ncbi:unnamed protein product, partial [Rotaria magnacalcarata]
MLIRNGFLQKYSALPENFQNHIIEEFRNAETLFFDLDGTLVKSRNPMKTEDGEVFKELLKIKKVVIVTGGKIGAVEQNLISQLPKDSNFKNLVILPLLGLEQWYSDGEATGYELQHVLMHISCLGQDKPEDPELAKKFQAAKDIFDPHGARRAELIIAIKKELPHELRDQ